MAAEAHSDRVGGAVVLPLRNVGFLALVGLPGDLVELRSYHP